MKRPVFSDSTGKRWTIVKWVSFVVFLCIYTFFLVSLMVYYYTNELPPIAESIIAVIANIVVVYFSIAIAIGIIRLLIFMYFSLRQKIRHKKQTFNDRYYRPTVSVLIPAYNEEVGIQKTVDSILESDYPIEEVIVIDDGSTDKTRSIVRRQYRRNERVRLISKKNGGKASALNVGIVEAIGEIIITVDADNYLKKDMISQLVKHFENPNVAAVSGNCHIGNLKKVLPQWQHIEYVTANNLEKRALDYLNCITVIPGSNSAWRKDVMIEAGFYEENTLAEDTDLTLKVIQKNYRIPYEEGAITIEECPETFKSFIKQRIRWSYGILQSMWKNKRAIAMSKNKALKYFAVPNMLITYFFHLTMPIADILFLIALAGGHYIVILFFIFFFISDSIASLYAFSLEKVKRKPLLWIFVQRLVYRYLFSYIVWKSLILAIKGSGLGWQKFERTGSHIK